jgi:predicted dehydrogenase
MKQGKPLNIWLIGAGPHAREYAKVLLDLGVSFEVIGRSETSALAFEAATGHAVRRGGLARALAESGAPAQAIVAASFEELANVALQLLAAGTRRILLEKPGGLNLAELGAVAAAAEPNNADVLVAYSRRFYASTRHARQMIEDGGALSCTFEFTEWAHTIVPMPLPDLVKQSWVIANSSHVPDLAFHLCGFPKEWKSWRAGGLDWHQAGARFCGAGVTERGVLFSYHADWEAPGRWAVEVLTRKRRCIFKPMEQLQVTMLASVKVELVVINDALDKQFKPGLHAETGAFLNRDDALFCTIAEQLEHGAVYSKMAGYAAAPGSGKTD